jgi:ribosome modulation factor
MSAGSAGRGFRQKVRSRRSFAQRGVLDPPNVLGLARRRAVDDDPAGRPAAVWRMVEIKKDQDIYREGIFARALGRSLESNPYSAEAKERAIWDMGWRMIDEDRQGLSTRAIKSVPDFRSDVVAPIAHRRLRQASAEVLAARQRVLQIVIVVAATALMIGLLIITSR